MERNGPITGQREELRGKLLAAMVREVAQRGYTETSVAHVLEAAGVARQTFYNLFENKEQCYLAAYDHVVERISEQVLAADDSGPWPERTRARLEAAVELLAAEPEVARFALVEFAAAGVPARLLYRTSLARFGACLDEGREYAEQDWLPQNVSSMAIGAAIALIANEVRTTESPDLTGRLPELYFSLLMPYLGPERATEQAQRAYGEDAIG